MKKIVAILLLSTSACAHVTVDKQYSRAENPQVLPDFKRRGGAVKEDWRVGITLKIPLDGNKCYKEKCPDRGLD